MMWSASLSGGGGVGGVAWQYRCLYAGAAFPVTCGMRGTVQDGVWSGSALTDLFMACKKMLTAS